MQVIILFFITIFSCGFSQEKNHPESADSNLLVEELPSAEENLVPEDGDSVNVDEILRQLKEERAKNRDLNQTISDILERMSDMERDIIRNKEEITQAQSSVVVLSLDVEDLQDEVIAVQDEVVTVAEDVERNSLNISDVAADFASLSSSDHQQAAQIQSLGTRGTWCGYQVDSWNKVGAITYNYTSFSDSNMNITGTPLDTNTGNYSHKYILS